MNEPKAVVRHPYRFRILWAIVYVAIIAAVISLMSLAANGIRTHSLPVGSAELSIPYSKYAVGENISFTIKNNYNSSIDVINHCPAEPLAVYYQVNGKWVRQHDQANIDECSDEDRQVSVQAGDVVHGDFKAWHNLFSKPGKYRIVAFVEYYNALPYQDIEVVAPVNNSNNIRKTGATNSTNTTQTNTTTTVQNTSNQTTVTNPKLVNDGLSDD